MDSEQREGIKEGMKARREGKVKPWREVKKELKPDQSRLLTDEEIEEVSNFREVAEAQDAKTASIVRAEVETECQARIEALIKWGMEVCNEHYRGGGVFTRRECPECWKSLAKYSKEKADD